MNKLLLILLTLIIFNFSYAYNYSGLKCGFEDQRCNCGLNNMDKRFLLELKKLENRMEKSFFITSGTRCENYNSRIEGGYNSLHLKGLAVDIRGKQWTNKDKKQFVRYAKESNYFTKVIEYTDTKHVHLEYRIGDSFSHTKTKKSKARNYADSYGHENYFYFSFIEVSASLGLNSSTDNEKIGFNNGWFIHKPYVKIWDFYYSGGREYKNFKSKNSYGFMFDTDFDIDYLSYTYLIYEEFFATADNVHYDNNFSFDLIDIGLGINIFLDESYYLNSRLGYRHILDDDFDIHYSYRALEGVYINLSFGLGGAPEFFN